MTIDQISEKLGSITTTLLHQTKALDGLTDAVSEMKESLIRGSNRMRGLEERLDDIEPSVQTHIEECRSAKDRKLGAEHYRKGVWFVIGSGGTAVAGLIAKLGMALFGGH